jgi:hypothetical protein
MAAKKKTLANMRFIQRRVLKLEEVEKNFKPEKRPLFCVTCRLNYRLTKKEHDESQSHKDIKKFLMPYCNICKLAFTSPITYEVHISSLQHLRVSMSLEFSHKFFLTQKKWEIYCLHRNTTLSLFLSSYS